jgi:SAM-dependent methyltransferase
LSSSVKGKRILDFGCGSGRVLRHFIDAAGEAEFWGCDINEACISWLRKHLQPPFRVFQNTEPPPLPFKDDYFDLILCVSVFSHLTDLWEPWLRELRRVLKPEGLALISFMNRTAYETYRGEQFFEDRIGMKVISPDRGWQSGGPFVYHSNWWIVEHWSRILRIEAIFREALDGFQSVALARKTDRANETSGPVVIQPFPYVPIRPDFKGNLDLDPFAARSWLASPGVALSPTSRLTGWFASARGSLVRLEGRVGARAVPVEARLGLQRPAVRDANPTFPDSLRSGFELTLNLAQIPRGLHELEITGFNLADEQLPITIQIRAEEDGSRDSTKPAEPQPAHDMTRSAMSEGVEIGAVPEVPSAPSHRGQSLLPGRSVTPLSAPRVRGSSSVRFLTCPLVIVFPARGNAFYIELALRMFSAARRLREDVACLSSDTLADRTPGLSHGIAAIVCPSECALSGQRSVRRLREFDARLAIVAESVGTQWYRGHFDLGLTYEALIDVGFVSQEAQHPFPSVPYRFLFNAPTPEEHVSISFRERSARPIPWAVIGHYTQERLHLVSELLGRVGAQGFVFLPPLRPVRQDQARLSPPTVRSLLSRTRYYVWCAHHQFPYFESFRFLDGLLAGAVPCKLDAGEFVSSAIPGVYSSLEALCDQLTSGNPWSAYEEARSFYLSKGSLPDRVQAVLASLGL